MVTPENGDRMGKEGLLSLLAGVERYLRSSRQPLALERLLRVLGEGLDLDRVMVIGFLPDRQEAVLGVRAGWHSRQTGQHPLLESGRPLECFSDGPFVAWLDPLRQGEVIGGAVSERPAQERAALAALGSRWFLALPLGMNGDLRGLLVLDDCRRVRRLDEGQRQVVRLSAAALVACLEGEVAWRQRLERDRLATMGRLAARVAHEINNPLAGIRNVLLLLHRELEGDERKQSRLALVDRELERVGRVIRRLFELHRNQETSAVPLACGPLIEEIFALLQGAAEEREVRLVLAGDTGLRLRLPESLLREVLFNLVLNAIEASPEGGSVEVLPGKSGGRPRIEVLDRGPGLPEQDPTRLLEPFYTTKEETGGLGLGLSICKELMESMNGELQLTEREGGGVSAALIFSREVLIGMDG